MNQTMPEIKFSVVKQTPQGQKIGDLLDFFLSIYNLWPLSCDIYKALPTCPQNHGSPLGTTR